MTLPDVKDNSAGSHIPWQGHHLLLATILLALLSSRPVAQQSFPDPPADLTKIYFLSDANTLSALPFESGITRFNVFQPAAEDKVARVRITGPTATTVSANPDLRFFVFVADRMDPPPHQLVRLTATKSDRSLKISVIRGRKGYAPFDEDNIRLQRRNLKRLSVPARAGQDDLRQLHGTATAAAVAAGRIRDYRRFARRHRYVPCAVSRLIVGVQRRSGRRRF